MTCLKRLKEENKVRSFRQFAQSLDYLPQSLNDIIHGKRDVTIELCRKAAETFHFNLNYVFLGEGEMFNNEIDNSDQGIVTVVTDNFGNECISYVDVEAQAGYGDNMHDAVFMKNLPSFTLPDPIFQQGTYRCFGIKGDSMEPTLRSGDKLVCSFVEPDHWDHAIKDNDAYILVTPHEVVVKRLKNRIKESGEVLCVSDNKSFEPYAIPVAELKEVWSVKMRLSKFLSRPSQEKMDVKEELCALKQNIKSQSQLIQSLNSTIENLLKQQRSQRLR